MSIAMISNLQIFIVGVPILIILGSDPQSSFFVRSVIIWMNDLAVVTLIFGNLMYSVHRQGGNNEEQMKQAVGRAINRVSVVQREKRGSSSGKTGSGALQTRSVMFSDVDENEDIGTAASSRHTKISKKSTASKSSKKSSTRKESRASRMTRNYSEYEQDNDESEQDTFADEKFTPGVSKKPVDVLAGTKSWANVNMSTFEVGGQDNDDDSTSETDEEAGNANGSGVISNKSPLPPASLPQSRPKNMSYAHDRINNIRGKHAKKKAARNYYS